MLIGRAANAVKVLLTRLQIIKQDLWAEKIPAMSKSHAEMACKHNFRQHFATTEGTLRMATQFGIVLLSAASLQRTTDM